MATCPNKNLQEWKDLEAKVGEDLAYYYWDKYNGIILESILPKAKPTIKPGVSELFESSEAPIQGLEAQLKNWFNEMGIMYKGVDEIVIDDNKFAIARADVLKGILEVVEGRRDATTLAEEAAHFLVKMLPKDNSLYKGLISNIENTAMYKKVYNEYYEMYEGNINKIKEEAVGKLIAQEVLNLYQETKETPKTNSWINRIFDTLLKWLGVKSKKIGLNSGKVSRAVDPYKQAADLLLDSEKARESINEGGLKKIYSKSSWNSKESDYYYQATSEATDKQKEVINNLRNITGKVVGNNYVTDNKTLKYRATSIVDKFYRTVFKTGNLTDNESKLRASIGTHIHKIMELLINSKVSNQGYTEFSITEAAKEMLLNNEEFYENYLKHGDEVFNLGNTGFKQLEILVDRLIKQIKDNSKTISRISGIEGEPVILTEQVVVDEAEDIGATIDLLVVYPNGAVGKYDFKSMNFYKGNGVSPVKMEAFEIQTGVQSRILSNVYGVTDFAENRIVPIDVRLTSDDRVYSVTAINDNLEQIPIKEFTGNRAFDTQLKKLYDYSDKLRRNLREDYRNEKLKTRLYRVDQTIQGLLVSKDLSFLEDELNAMLKELDLLNKVETNSTTAPLSKEEIQEKLREMIEFIEVAKGIAGSVEDYLGRKTVEKDKDLDISLSIIERRLSTIEREVTNKFIDEAATIGGESDIRKPAKKLGFFSRYLSSIFEIDNPIIQKVKSLTEYMSFSVINEVTEIVKDITTKIDAVDKWATNNGMSLLDAYDIMINEKSGNLMGMLSSEFYNDLKSIKDSPKQLEKWFKSYYTFDLEAFRNKRAEYVDRVNNEHKGKYKQKLRESLISNYDEKYDVRTSTKAINDNNWFLKLKKEKLPSKYINPEWVRIQSTPELKSFYDTLIEYNKQFSAMTGKEISPLFLAEIRKDMISRLADNGLGSLFEMKRMFMEGLETQQIDTLNGVKDPVTGEFSSQIPLLYTNKLLSDLSPSELALIEKDATSKYPKGSNEYLEYFKSEFNKARRRKGLQTKSKDLGRSLILFAKAAYTYKYLAESEAFVKNLQWYAQNNGGTIATDASGKPVTNKYTNKMLEILGMPKDEQELLSTVINSVWYGKKILDKDKIIGKKVVKDSEGNVIDDSIGFSSNKLIRNFLSYVSIKALAFNPIVAAGNVVGTRGNLQMIASEGIFLTKKNYYDAQKAFYSDREKYMAASEILKPYANDVLYEVANNLASTKLEKFFTVENAFFMMKKPDEVIDRLITNSMIRNYGVDSNGKIRRLANLPEGSKSLHDLLSKNEDTGVWSFEGVSNKELSRFRTGIFKLAYKIKGTTPEDMKAAYSRTIAGRVLLQFRSWVPGLFSARFGDIKYDNDLDGLEVGRFKVFWGEIVNSGGFINGLKEFTKLIIEATVTGYFNPGGLKKANLQATKKAYEEFKLTNPEEAKGVSLEDFVELRKAKLLGMAAELRLYFLLMMLAMLAKSIIPDDDKDKVGRLIARNSYMMANKGFLELSFFLTPSSVDEVLKRPIPSFSFFTDIQRFIFNTFGETYQFVTGEEDKRDQTGIFHYATGFVPGGKVVADVFELSSKPLP